MRDLRLTQKSPVSLSSFVLLLATVASRPALAAPPTMTECLAANESAIRLRSGHKLRASRDQSLVCAEPTCPGEVRDACGGRVKELTAAIPTVVFDLKDATGNDVTAASVSMDGQPVAPRLEGTAVAVDPGDHVFSFSVAGQVKLEKRLVIFEGEKNRRERLAMGLTAASPVSVAAVAVPGPGAAASPGESVARPASASSGLGLWRGVGLTLGGAGVVGVGVGAAFGAMTMSAWSRVTSACGAGGPSRCPIANQAAVSSDQSSAKSDGAVSTAAFIAGGALLAGGAVLFFTAGRKGQETSVAVVPAVGPGQGGMSVLGAF